MTTAKRDWSRKYPPLTGLAVIVVLLIVLPSSLVQPQANPTTTLEYAPVPPDRNAGPPGGNFGSLGLGSSPTLTGGFPGGLPGQGGSPPGTGGSPSALHCVGNPPRQTEDPLSPPCVGYFQGNNGGRTYQGVTANEVRVLIYTDGFPPSGDDYNEYDCGKFTDLAQPGKGWSFPYLRAYARYFNSRFQTYGRFVHFWVQSSRCTYTAEARRADAQDGFDRIKPFAVFPYVIVDNLQVYLEAMAAKGVVGFIAPSLSANQPRSFLEGHRGLLWSYGPTLEHQAALYAEYVCKKIVPFPAHFSGNPGENGGRRRLGQLYANDPAVPELRYLSELIKQKVEACGGRIDLTRRTTRANTFTPAGEQDPGGVQEVAREAALNVAAFQQKGITTILWTGLTDVQHSHSAAAINYRPELVVIGFGNMDVRGVGQLQDQSVWRNARTVTQATYVADYSREVCYLAAREANPNIEEEEPGRGPLECLYDYPTFRQIFTGIQVAGPRLTPQSLDQGFHAIPDVASTDPSVPACFYNRGDYSCVKDAIDQYWDPTASAPGDESSRGCYLVPEGGKRFLLGTWSRQNADARDKRASDPCNSFGGDLVRGA